eukprot:403339816
MAFRTSSGDFNVDSYKDQSSALVIISWGVWIIAVMLLNVMFMNFIIAVISESYEKVMQKLVAESYKVKVQMIVEIELHFSKEELTSEKYFPRYLLLRRPVSSSDSESGEWQGFVKDIKNTIKTTTTKQKSDFHQEIQSQCSKLQDDTQAKHDLINANIQNINKQLQSQDSKIEQINKQLSEFIKIEQLNKQMTDFIREQQQQNQAIMQLLQNLKPIEIKLGFIFLSDFVKWKSINLSHQLNMNAQRNRVQAFKLKQAGVLSANIIRKEEYQQPPMFGNIARRPQPIIRTSCQNPNFMLLLSKIQKQRLAILPRTLQLKLKHN